MKKKIIILLIGLCFLIGLIIIASYDKPTEVVLGQYTDIKVEVYETVVTDTDVENALIDAVIVNQENVNITNRAVRKGDIVNIDYTGKVADIAFDGGTATEYDLEIGSDSFIEGFEEQIIGMKVGQIGDIKVTFPSPYPDNTELSGAEAIFTIKVNSISGKEVPAEITDAMIKEISDTYTTVEEYREYIRSKLEAEVKEIDDYNKRQAVFNIVDEKSTVVSLSNKKVRYYSNLFADNYQYYADMYGVNLSEFIETYMGKTVAEFNDEKKAYAEETTGKCGLIEAIAVKESISVSADEYESYLDENGIDSDGEKKYGESIKDDLLYQKVTDFIISKAQITVID